MSKVQPHSRRSQMTLDAYNTLARMGIPMHYETIAKLIYKKRGINLDKYPWWSVEFKKRTRSVLDAILAHPELFRRTNPGAYFLTGKAANVCAYPELEEIP